MQELKAELRTEHGRRVNALRKKGLLPAVLYGEQVLPQSLVLPSLAFERIYRAAGESTLVKLTVGAADYNVLIHDVAHDPLKGSPIHADFYAVRMDKKLRATVSLVFTGESPAVKNLDGVLVKVVQELEVEALPQDLPHELTADISGLTALEQKLTIGDIAAPSGVTIVHEPDEVIAVVEPPRSEEEIAELKAAPAGEIELVKTEAELKREEREKEEGKEE